MFDAFKEDINSFGLTELFSLYNEAKKEEDNTSSTQTTTKAQTYEQTQQATTSVNKVTSPLDNKILVYGGLGVVALLFLKVF